MAKILSDEQFNLTFLLSLLAKPLLNSWLIQKCVDALVGRFMTYHGYVIDRMAEYAPVYMVMEPRDLPISFFVHFSSNKLDIQVIEKGAYTSQDPIIISAKLATFISILEGNLDGDALFFSRELSITGDTTSIVALRNILEAESIDINEDIKKTFGSFASMVVNGKDFLSSTLSVADAKLEKIKASIVNDIQYDSKHQQEILLKQKKEIKDLLRQHNLLNDKINSIKKTLNKQEVNE